MGGNQSKSDHGHAGKSAATSRRSKQDFEATHFSQSHTPYQIQQKPSQKSRTSSTQSATSAASQLNLQNVAPSISEFPSTLKNHVTPSTISQEFRIHKHIHASTQEVEDVAPDWPQFSQGTLSSFSSVSTAQSGRFSVNSSQSSRSSVSQCSKFSPASSPAITQALYQGNATQIPSPTSKRHSCTTTTPFSDTANKHAAALLQSAALAPNAATEAPSLSAMANTHVHDKSFTYDDERNNSVAWRLHVAQLCIMTGVIQDGFDNILDLATKYNHVSVYYALGVCYHRGWHPGKQPDFVKALAAFERAAFLAASSQSTISHTSHTPDDGALAQYTAACMIMRGQDGGPPITLSNLQPPQEGMPSDRRSTAFQYMLLAAHNGHPRAQLCIGNYYATHKQFSSAEKYYRIACETGLADAQVMLAKLLLRQLEQTSEKTLSVETREQMIRQVLDLLARAADQNHNDALRVLGSLYEDGHYVSRDLQHAVDCYTLAFTDPSHPDYGHVHHMIGCHYKADNKTLARDDARARHHFELAAQVEYGQALRELGNIHAAQGTREGLITAHEYYKRAVRQHDVIAMGYLGEQFEYGRGCPIDYTQAIMHYNEATKRGSIPGRLALANLLFRLQKFDDAFALFESMATLDTKKLPPMNVTQLDQIPCRLRAHVMVAKMRMGGYGQVRVNRLFAFRELQALSRFSEASHLPLKEVDYLLGLCYHDGLKDGHGYFLVRPDLQQAIACYTKGADGGDADCQVKLGELFYNGYPVQDDCGTHMKKDRRAAFDLFHKAAGQGHAMGYYYKALYYLNGVQPVQAVDQQRARTLLQRAAQQGVAPAMVALAQCLLIQPVSKDDINEARNHLVLAKQLGEVTALRGLASMYERGLIEAEENVKWKIAYALLKEAADKNDVKALCDMARYHEKGLLDGKLDPGEAQNLLKRAQNCGYAKAKILLAELLERTEGRDSALLIYQKASQEHEPFTQVGWSARMGKVNLVLQGAGGARERSEVYEDLVAMTSQRHLHMGNDFMDAMELLGLCFERGVGTDKDVSSAMQLYQEVLAYQTAAPFYAARERTRVRLAGLYIQRHDTVAALQQLSLVEPHLDQMKKDPTTMHMAREAQYYLGCLLLDDASDPGQRENGLAWLQRAADQGSTLAFYKLGETAKATGDEGAAKYYFERGMSGNHPESTREYGLLLLQESVHNDGASQYNSLLSNKQMQADAIDHLERAVGLGDMESSFQLGYLYLYGFGSIQRHLKTALLHFETAQQHNHPLASVYVGEVHFQMGQHAIALPRFRNAPQCLLSQLRMPLYVLHGWADMSVDHNLALQQLQELVDKFQGANPLELSKDTAMTLAEAYYWLGYILDKNLKRPEVAMQWYRRAVEDFCNTPFVEAYYQIGIHYMTQYRQLQPVSFGDLERHSEGNAAIHQALVHLRRAANMNHGLANYQLGNYHLEQDETEKAIKYYECAIQLNTVEAMLAMGDLYFEGKKPSVETKRAAFPRNRREAYKYYHMAAKLGNGRGACIVAGYYDEGYSDSGIQVNRNEALMWYTKAFEWSGDPTSALGIAQIKYAMAEELSGTSPNPELAKPLYDEAYQWFLRADGKNHTAQQYIDYILGHCLLYGVGHVEHNPEAAFQRLNRAAASGNTDAFEDLVRCYEEGIGTARDYGRAFEWLLSMVQMSSHSALERVRMYRDKGRITDEDYRRAEAGYNLAADQSCASSSYSSNSSIRI